MNAPGHAARATQAGAIDVLGGSDDTPGTSQLGGLMRPAAQADSSATVRNAPRGPRFGYWQRGLAVLLAAAVVAALLDPGSQRAERVPDALFVCVASLGAYAIMRIVVFLVTQVAAASTRLVRQWAIAWLYGAIPLALAGLYVGSYSLNAPTPNLATVALVVAVPAAMAIAACGAAVNNRPT